MKSPRNTPAREKTSTKKPFTKAETTDTTKITMMTRSAKFIRAIPSRSSANEKPAHIFPASGELHLREAPAQAAAYSNPLPADSRARIVCQTKVVAFRERNPRWAKSATSLELAPHPPAQCLLR